MRGDAARRAHEPVRRREKAVVRRYSPPSPRRAKRALWLQEVPGRTVVQSSRSSSGAGDSPGTLASVRGSDAQLRAVRKNSDARRSSVGTGSEPEPNRNVVSGSVVSEIASRLGKPPVSVYYRALIQLGLVVLDGTKSTDHMREDLEVLEFELDAADVAAIDRALS